jgi:CheY-like chemotaxis protein
MTNPLLDRSLAAGQNVVTDASTGTFSRRARRVLLAEDNPVNRMVAVRILEKLGCLVDVASNGLEAMEMAFLFPYEAIFMDCGMPEMDGYAATREIRLRQPRLSRVPIVAVTANAIAGAREECLEAGMDDYIAKPILSADLERALVKWCP